LSRWHGDTDLASAPEQPDGLDPLDREEPSWERS
jgi:hypothetical protein